MSGTAQVHRCIDPIARGETAEIRRDLRDTADEARAAKATADGLSWKLNLVLAGVGATFALLVALVGWTVSRVDLIEDRTRAAAALYARDTAREECARLSRP